MYYINDDAFDRLFKASRRVETHDAWGLQKRLEAYPVIRQWDSGEEIGAASGQWEEQARLIDPLSGDLFLEVREVYHGERHCNKKPRFYRIPRKLYMQGLLLEEAQK